MSVRMALAKLCVCACGGALIGGGAVHYAERPAGLHAKRVIKSRPVAQIHPARRATAAHRPAVAATRTSCAPAVATVANADPVPAPQPFVSGGGGIPVVVGGGGGFFGGSGFAGGFGGGGVIAGGNDVMADKPVDPGNPSKSTARNDQVTDPKTNAADDRDTEHLSQNQSPLRDLPRWQEQGEDQGGQPGTLGGPPQQVPAPPMVLLFGAAAAALVRRRRKARPAA